MSKSKSPEIKTNVMRIIEQKNVQYFYHTYVDTGAVSGKNVAIALGQDMKRVFKTLVTVTKSGVHYVFVLPVDKELNLKKAAKSVNEKSVEMIKLNELLPLTGYIHGGCSPIGMKNFFTTIIDASAKNFETIIFSAGKIGYQVELSPIDLSTLIDVDFADIVD